MRKAVGVLIVVVVLAVAWSAAWFAASIYASRQVDGFIASETRQGRDWT